MKPRVALLNPVLGLHGGTYRVSGTAYGHPNIQNGEWVTSSEIVGWVLTGNTVETLNTVYVLGEKVTVSDMLNEP